MGRAMISQRSGQQGFTLIELIVVIVISGVLAISLSQLIQRPIEGYQAQSRRAQLVDIAETALLRMTHDIRDALPNSVRVGCGGRCIEYLRTLAGGRYRSRPENNPFSLSFDPSKNDTSFEVLGFLNNGSQIRSGGGSSDCRTGAADCVVVYNTGSACTNTGTEYLCTAGEVCTNAYEMGNAATVTGVTEGARITIDFDNSGFCHQQSAFPTQSPDQRFYIVDTPVTYLCDLGQGSIRRYQGYNIRASQTAVDSHAELTGQGNPAEHALLADSITACSFRYDPGSPTRNGLVIMSITVSQNNEQVTLLQQAHVANMP